MSKLPNAPLKEVVFDVLWEMIPTPDGFLIDSGFDFAQGIFAQKIRQSLPVHKRTMPDSAPMVVYRQPIHQFWRGELTWPLVQFGRGILTVNEIEGSYDWTHYGQLIDEALATLSESYAEPLILTQVQLRYVDAVELTNEQFADLSGFVANNLRIRLINDFSLPSSLSSLQIQQGFNLPDGSQVTLSINDGRNTSTQRPAVIWTTTIVKRGHFSVETAGIWKEEAHRLASDMFRDMISPSFYQTFL
jgi:uncharacterized protein (TIGR04255 family)